MRDLETIIVLVLLAHVIALQLLLFSNDTCHCFTITAVLQKHMSLLLNIACFFNITEVLQHIFALHYSCHYCKIVRAFIQHYCITAYY